MQASVPDQTPSTSLSGFFKRECRVVRNKTILPGHMTNGVLLNNGAFGVCVCKTGGGGGEATLKSAP